MNIYDLRMNGFSTDTAVCLQTLHNCVLTSVANAFYAQMIHMITCSEMFAKSSVFLGLILVYFGQICRQVPPKSFVLGGDVLLKLYEQKNIPCNSNIKDIQMVLISGLRNFSVI